MNKNLDLVKILKNVPDGTKLWSPVYGECTFLGMDDHYSEYPIVCEDKKGIDYGFTKEGKLFVDYDDNECVLFPSKDNRDWSTFKTSIK